MGGEGEVRRGERREGRGRSGRRGPEHPQIGAGAGVMKSAGRHGVSTFVFLLPWLLTFAIFSLYPLLSAFYTSFTHYRIVETGPPRFVGLDNYARLLHDPLFWKSLLNTFIFVIGTIPLTTVGALLVAVGLNRKLPLRGLFRAGY